jgi:hypothetical protein
MSSVRDREEIDFARVAALAPSEELFSHEEMVSEEPKKGSTL